MKAERQIEFDYMKGIFMLFIFLIHAFQATASDMSTPVRAIYMFATMTGAALYIFVAGFGIAYSDRMTPVLLVKRGVGMVIFQYLTNLLYVIALAIPYLFVKNSISEEASEFFRYMEWVYVQYINIFFITGIIYLVLALLVKIRLTMSGYIVLAAVVAIIAPIVYGTEVDIPVLGYVVTLLIGEAPFTSFTPLYYLPYALIGVASGKMYRKISDKMRFYKRILPVCIIVIISWWVTVFVHCFNSPDGEPGMDFDLLFEEMDYAYSCPDIWHMIASVAHIIFFASLIYFYTQYKSKKDRAKGGFISSQLLFYNRNISAYYALHVPVYLIALGIHGYEGFDSTVCLLLVPLSMAVTEIMVRAYNRFRLRYNG